MTYKILAEHSKENTSTVREEFQEMLFPEISVLNSSHRSRAGNKMPMQIECYLTRNILFKKVHLIIASRKVVVPRVSPLLVTPG
jgi:hypothetical protein